MYMASFPVYGLNERILEYSISGPTQSAVFEGNVHGVVVHARKYTGSVSMPKRGCDFASLMTSNWQVAVVSVTSL